MIYEPGRDEHDPLDYLSRHPTTEKNKDKTDEVIKWMMCKENTIVIEKSRMRLKRAWHWN